MARIMKENFKKIQKERNNVHIPARSTYSVFKTVDGKKYFQIDTFGTTERMNPEKISQSIQFDAEFATELIRIISDELLVLCNA